MRVRHEIVEGRSELTTVSRTVKDRFDDAPEVPRRILLAERACAEKYPPLLHQAAILSQLGHVTVLDALGRQDNPGVQTAPQVERIRVRASNNMMSGPAIANAKWAFRYAREFRRQLAHSPDVVVAYEPDAAALLLRERACSARTMRIVHLHEIPDKRLYSDSIVSKVAIRYMLTALKRADLIIVPDEDRAAYTMEMAKLERLPTVVMNCPRVLEHLPPSKLLPWLSERGISTNRIVHFQGSIGAERGLKRVIASMRYWPTDTIFVIVGDGSAGLQQELREQAARENVSERVFFVGRVPYADVISFAVGATLGITLMEPINNNWRFGAGASNKRFEYAALGIPQVTNTGAGMQRVFEASGIAILVDIADTEMIGKTIARLLLDRSFASEIGVRARALHLSRYNYEAQFAPVAKRIRDWTSARAVKRI
jgi:glycosyltransferase involved in cell wall biosynthesis